ncbi:MAG: DEAD/DEAH box helicase [Gammaproteobacteria bacterium]|nr:DEAD/DEAH box helicase [Gammaproteobacteria bacterium]
MAFESFHPVVARWFREAFGAATDCQCQAWPAIRSGRHTLIAAPTGSGKTFAAFLCAIDRLLVEGLQRGGLEDATQILYVSPLKSLSNDIHRNLQLPLEGIRAGLAREGLPEVEIRAQVRTGDTPAGERARMRRQPPHILVTTPESLFILLTSESGRAALGTVNTVIVDEIHALAGNKRGAHLALSLERLMALTGAPPMRIGLSATQRPVEAIADFLVGNREEPRRIVDMGHVKHRDIALELTPSPLQAVMAAEQWAEIYDRLAALVDEHWTTLVFVNTRRLAERAARHLAERLGEEAVTSHHGSLAREHRLDAEQRLKAGKLRVLVATASLELGIDIGDVDLVCQLGSPRLISTFLQRVGRSGHAVGGTPKGRLFPTTRDELVECVALLDSVRRHELEMLTVAGGAVEVLAQQIVAETSAREWPDRELFSLFRRAWPYRELSRESFESIVDMLANGFSTRRGRRGALVYHDAVNGRLRGRKSARLTALTNGGTIPDQFDYDVVLEPEDQVIGTLNEDFAFESLPGDIFQLGNTSYRIQKVERGTVRVTDANGAPPGIPFWFGEAPGRSDELSASVSRLREEFERRWTGERESVAPWLAELDIGESAVDQLIEYLGTALLALEVLPTHRRIVFERFFDESGDTHLVIHSPFGSRINRAWGLALRKRFCRRFNFELQAAALEDSIVLSLSATHSFPLEEVRHYLKSANAVDVLTQALLDAPIFGTRWRWNATTALAVRRNRNGRRVAPQLQRMDAEDLIAVVFPDQLACQENLAGEREVPEHPLVQQTVSDCLYEAMDVAGLQRVLADIEAHRIEIVTRDLALPSPLAQEILTARPYAFLDDAPAEERRTSAVQARGVLDPETARNLGQLDGQAIEKVRGEAWPGAENMDELHDALVLLGGMTDAEIAAGQWQRLAQDLRAEGRAAVVTIGDRVRWTAVERLQQWRLLHPDLACDPGDPAVAAPRFRVRDRDEALREIVRSRLEGSGPVTADALAGFLCVNAGELEAPLAALEAEGFAMQGRFTGNELEWCERRLLARINRATVDRLRREIEAVSPADYMRFLLEWQGLVDASKPEGETALSRVMAQLEGVAAPVAAWERDLLPTRLEDYHPGMLDRACLTGRLVWERVPPGAGRADNSRQMSRGTLIRFVPRRRLACWRNGDETTPGRSLSPAACRLLDAFTDHGALYVDELQDHAGLGDGGLARGLRELAAAGRVTSDSFRGLTELLAGADGDIGETGRWSLLRCRPVDDSERILHVAWVLLRRYGVVFRKVLQREQDLPPWRELLRVYRRLEARGEVRGGRFVSGFSGEQFALPEAIAPLRRQRRSAAANELVAVGAGDPLNLVGIIVPGDRLAIQSRECLVLREGIPVALQQDGRLRFLTDVAAEEQWRIRNRLLTPHHPAHSLN